MKRKKTKLIVIAAVVSLLIIGGALAYLLTRPDDIPPPSVPSPEPSKNEPAAPAPAPPAPAFDKQRLSIDRPDSLWVIVNKKRPLPSNFVPALAPVGGSNLQPEAVQALEQLLKAASDAQIPLRVVSGYRSYSTQASVYNSYVQKDGQAAADTYSARPGHSEHQTGLAADLGNGSGQCDLEICFAATAGGKWLAAHAHTYGFTIRYTEPKTVITGYQYEPWHIRYVGADLAAELYASGQTMEEFFGLPAAPGY